MVYNHGLMVLNTKDIGERIKLMEKELSGMYMEINLKETGKMIRLTATVSILTVMAHVTRETGNMISNMDGE